MMCEGGVISIYFTHCNGIPHCGQIMGRVGKKSRAELTKFDAKWMTLDEGFEAKVVLVVVMPKIKNK